MTEYLLRDNSCVTVLSASFSRKHPHQYEKHFARTFGEPPHPPPRRNPTTPPCFWGSRRWMGWKTISKDNSWSDAQIEAMHRWKKPCHVSGKVRYLLCKGQQEHQWFCIWWIEIFWDEHLQRAVSHNSIILCAVAWGSRHYSIILILILYK